MPLIPTVQPGPFYDFTNTMNLTCLAVMALLLFVAIYLAVSMVSAWRSEHSESEAQPTRAERRRMG